MLRQQGEGSEGNKQAVERGGRSPGSLTAIEPGWIRRSERASTAAMSAEALSPEEQQARWLDEGKAVVKQQAFLMFVPVASDKHFICCPVFHGTFALQFS